MANKIIIIIAVLNLNLKKHRLFLCLFEYIILTYNMKIKLCIQSLCINHILYSIHLFSYQKIFIFYHKDYSIHIVA